MLITVAAAVVVFVGIWFAREILVPVAVAAVVVIIAHPVRRPLERRGWPRWLATTVVIAVGYAILAVLGLLLVVASAQFIAILPDYADELQATAQGVLDWLESLGFSSEAAGTAASAIDPEQLLAFASGVADAVLGAATAFFFVLAYVMFMAADAARFSRGSSVFGGAVADAIGSRYFSGVRRYYVVNAWFGAVVAVLDGLLLWALGIPVPITWAILAFVTNFIPNIGFVIGLIPPAVLALVIGGWPLALVVVLAYSRHQRGAAGVRAAQVRERRRRAEPHADVLLAWCSGRSCSARWAPSCASRSRCSCGRSCSTPTRGRGRSDISPAIPRRRSDGMEDHRGAPSRAWTTSTANPRVRRGFTRDSGAGSGAGSSLQTHDRGGTNGGVRVRPGRAVSRRIRGRSPDDGTLDAIRELVEGGEIRLIDLLVISREDDGSVLITDYDEVSDEYGFADVELAAIGLVADEDAQEFAQGIPPGTSGALLAIELLWAKDLASKFAASGGIVLQTERIPAPVVNAVLAEAEGGVGTCRSGEWDDPGLVGMAARTAVVAGTATAVSGGVRRHQADKQQCSTSSSSTRPSSSRRR